MAWMELVSSFFFFLEKFRKIEFNLYFRLYDSINENFVVDELIEMKGNMTSKIAECMEDLICSKKFV